eukprot:COSAG05_NODE_11117_length_529_cov_26.506977_1_plen_145_part_01
MIIESHNSTQPCTARIRAHRHQGKSQTDLQSVGLEPALSYHLMIRQKDHSANAEHCDTGTPEIRIHIPAGTGRSTVTVEIYRPQSPNPRQICTCIHVCMHRDPAVMRADAWNHISHRTSANAVQISYLSVYAIHPALAHNITVIL